MNRVGSLFLAATCGALASGFAHAENHEVAVKIGAFGLGVEYGRPFGERLAFRVGLNGGGFGFDAEESGIAYDFDVSFDSLSAAIDFHPTAKAFRLTAGLLRNDNGLDAVSRVTSNVEVGSNVYTPDEVGTLRAATSFPPTAPFAGVGWDWARSKRFFGVSFDIGVLDQGSPKVSLTADGGLVSDPQFADDIAAEQAELNDSLEDFRLLPYATLGFVFRF